MFFLRTMTHAKNLRISQKTGCFENLLHVRRIEPYVWGSEPSDEFPPAQETMIPIDPNQLWFNTGWGTPGSNHPSWHPPLQFLEAEGLNLEFYRGRLAERCLVIVVFGLFLIPAIKRGNGESSNYTWRFEWENYVWSDFPVPLLSIYQRVSVGFHKFCQRSKAYLYVEEWNTACIYIYVCICICLCTPCEEHIKVRLHFQAGNPRICNVRLVRYPMQTHATQC